MIVVMLVTLLYVAFVTQSGSKGESETSVTIKKKELVFKDEANGDISVWFTPEDSVTPGLANSNAPRVEARESMMFHGEQGFLRGTLRALARERKSRNLSPEAPFELALHQDGRLSITDSLTHNSIDLEAFGPDNLSVFVNILNADSMPASSAMSTPKIIDNTKENL
jgi:putative photosynthetic complex assembly protein